MSDHPAKNAFERHGRVGVAGAGRRLAHADGTPFFYLADTAWSGALLASDADWRMYLADRVAKGFTAIQFILAAPWAAAPVDEMGQQAYRAKGAGYEINPSFFERMDQRVAAVNEAGLLAVPVLAWAANFGASGQLNPGASLPSKFLRQLIQFQVDRYEDRHLIWILTGDGRYGGLRSLRWKRIGRAVFGDHPHAPVAMHSMGKLWPYTSFRREKWLDILGYQSSHADDSGTLQWLLEGPPARAWEKETRPIINLEPCYEGIRNWAAKGVIAHREVRRAMYASLLNSPTAGVTYGAHGVWNWGTQAEEPLNHTGCGVAPPWHQAMMLPGSLDAARLAQFFKSIEWWRLQPAQDLLDSQPANNDWSKYISCAATPTRDLAVCYLPAGGAVSLKASMATAHRWDPRTGDQQSIPAGRSFTSPSADDWILLLQNAS